MDLGDKFPIYAIKLRGDKAGLQFVRTYEVLYSNDGTIFSQSVDNNGKVKNTKISLKIFSIKFCPGISWSTGPTK